MQGTFIEEAQQKFEQLEIVQHRLVQGWYGQPELDCGLRGVGYHLIARLCTCDIPQIGEDSLLLGHSFVLVTVSVCMHQGGAVSD